MDEDLIRLIFFGVVILFWVLAQAVKKSLPKKPVSQQPRVERLRVTTRQVEERPRLVLEESEPRQAPKRSAGPFVSEPPRTREARPQRGLAEELLEMLQGRIEPEQLPEQPLELVEIDDEAESLETVEPTGRESHDRFHALYVEGSDGPKPYALDQETADRPYAVESPTVKPYLVKRRARAKPGLSRKELRHAFVMREVLGPPKALE